MVSGMQESASPFPAPHLPDLPGSCTLDAARMRPVMILRVCPDTNPTYPVDLMRFWNPVPALLLLVGLLSTSCAAPPSEPALEGPVHEFIEAFNAHDVNRMATLVHEDITWLAVQGDSVSVQSQGVDMLKSGLSGYFEAIPSALSTVEAVMEADRFVSVWERAHWESNGQPASQSSLAVYEVVDDRIKRVWYYPEMD